MTLQFLDRDDFLNCYWDYQPGEHVFLCEPTQQGKSYLAYQLVQQTLPQLENHRFVSLMPKPRDPATRQWAARIGLKVIDSWPPPPRWPLQEKPAGYVLWPKHARNLPPKENRERLAGAMRPALREQYWKGHSITLADDAHIAGVLLGLNDQFEEHLTAGAGMGAGLWLANQKPSGTVGSGSLTSFAYSAPSHLFFGHDTDERNIRRFSEIGGVDPDLVAWHVRRLRMWRIRTPGGMRNVSEKLYIGKAGPYMALIGP